MRITVTLLATIMLLATPNIAAAATTTLTLTFIIASVSTAIGVISVIVVWSFLRSAPVPICKNLTFVRSKKQGDDRICVYVYENKKYEVMLSAMKNEHPDIKGCPDSVHPKA